ncbi:MAG TPA: hypothetical protein VGM47_03645 [Gammaproteobacteria bacterium]|jgi:uncharacterized membrane protein
MSEVEKLGWLRRQLLIAGVLTFAVWDGAEILAMTPGIAPGSHHLLYFTSMLFGASWLVCLGWLWIVLRRIKARPEVFAALNDEMTIRNRWRASRVTMVVVMVCLMAGAGLADYTHFSAALALAVLIWVVVVSKIGLYLWFERSE